jgi:7-cyano-7-deazaguanine synthase in queuosine biosynthesis
MQMLETFIKAFFKALIVEQKEQEQNEEIKELFQRWIDEYSASYLIHRKNVRSDSWSVVQMSIKKHRNFIFISLNFKERNKNDWLIIAYNRKDKSIYCVNTKAFAYNRALALPRTLALPPAYYVEHKWLSKLSVDQFHRVMDVTKGNYAQFEALISRLSDLNQRNANAI